MLGKSRVKVGLILMFGTVLSPLVRSQENPLPPSRDRLIETARELMQSVRYCALITLDESGHPQARTMDPFPPGPDLTVWLATNRTTRKVGQIRSDPRATLYYFDPKSPGYVTLIGKAEIVDDPERKAVLWKKEWALFYEQANRGEEYTLIRFVPKRLEVVSFQHGIAAEPRVWKPAVLDLP